MSNEQHVENLMSSTMENLKDMIDVNKVIGEPIETKDGTYIIPVSKLSFGFASGGSEYLYEENTPSSSSLPFGGGSGAGVSVKPVSFLVVKQDSVRMLPVNQDTTYDRIVDTVPQVLEMVKSLVKDMCYKKDKNSCTSTTTTTTNVSNTSEENLSTDDTLI